MAQGLVHQFVRNVLPGPRQIAQTLVALGFGTSIAAFLHTLLVLPALGSPAAIAGGMTLMREDGERLVRLGISTEEELIRVTRD